MADREESHPVNPFAGMKSRNDHLPTPSYEVYLASFEEHFHPELQLPPLLLRFANWVHTKTLWTLGDFRIESNRWSDFYCEESGDLYRHFAQFLHTGNGSDVAFWLPDGCIIDSPPVVFIGSEGDLGLLAGTLEEFLWKLAHATTRNVFLDTQSESAERESLKLWLGTQGISESPRAEFDGNFEEWFNGRTTLGREFRDRDPTLIQIADILRHIAPPPADAPLWWNAAFDVFVAGTQFQMWHRHYGQIPLPRSALAELEPLIRQDRERRAKNCPERGRWFTAWLTVGRTGGARLACTFYEKPKLFEIEPDIPASDLKIDLRDYPRSDFWMPQWLKEKVQR